jgi:hypothetical protein
MPALLLLVLLLLPALSWAQCPAVTQPQTAYASESLTVSTTPIKLTTSVYKPPGVLPSMAVLSVLGGTITYVEIGTPTPSLGHPAVGSFIICGLDSLAAFTAVRSSSTDATMFVTYYKLSY